MKLTPDFRILILLVLAPVPALASESQWTLDLSEASPSGMEDSKPPSLKQRIGISWDSYFQSHPSLKKMKLGLRFEGTSSLSRNESLPMLPASVQKVLTAAAALKVLGPDFRFENSFQAELDSTGSIARNLKFKVSGDPTWGHEAFEGGLDTPNENLNARLLRVIDELRSRLVHRLEGPIDIEVLRPGLSRFVRPVGWRQSWNLECMAVMQTEFQANGNCGQFRITSLSRYGWVTDGVSVPIRMKLARSREGVNSIQAVPTFDSNGRIIEYVFTGHFAKGPVIIDLPVHQGTEWLKNLFIERLAEAGIEYRESPYSFSDSLASDTLTVDLSSRPLLEILRQAVQYSINGVMDRIYLEVAFQHGEDRAEGIFLKMIREWVADETLMTGIKIEDGSGLNLLNRMRPDTLFQVLSYLRRESFFPDLFSTLAIAGKAGTLLNRSTLVASTYTYNKIFAKTGTLNGITNLAGYFMPELGTTPEPFVVFSDSAFSAEAARPMIDGIVVNFAAQNSK